MCLRHKIQLTFPNNLHAANVPCFIYTITGLLWELLLFAFRVVILTSRRDVIVTCTDFPNRSLCIFWSCILHLYICCTTMKRSTQLDSKYLRSIWQKPVQIDRRLTLSLQIYHFDRHNESIAMKIYIADSLLHFDSISAHFVLI